MRRFILKLSLFVLPVALAIIIMANGKVIPFSSSISLDSKIYELKLRNFDRLETIAVGSSMTLNNLNSEVWVKETGDSSFYNISSWGQSITDDSQLIRVLVPIYHPSRVVIFAHCSDFYNSGIENISLIGAYLRHKLQFSNVHFKVLSIYSDTEQLYSDAKKDTLEYTNLNYDAFGGVALNVYGSHIEDDRWNKTTNFVFSPDNGYYSELSDLCSYLKEQDITLIMVNTPSRFHYCSDRIDDVYKHIHHCDSILTSHGQIFINEMDFQAYPDTLFADCSHLNRHGASILTKNVCARLDEIDHRTTMTATDAGTGVELYP